MAYLPISCSVSEVSASRCCGSLDVGLTAPLSDPERLFLLNIAVPTRCSKPSECCSYAADFKK